MIIFHKLTMRNFLSYGNNVTEIDLNVDAPTLIIGKNYDSTHNGMVDSNGAGKTTCINAIVFGLYGKPLSKIKMDKLINNINKKDMEVSITFQIGEMYYKVTRWRKMKSRGGDGVELLYRKNDMNFNDPNTVDFTKDKTPDSIRNTNDRIVEILGLPYDICARIMVYSGSYEPFLSLPASHTSKTNQRDIMEELCGITIVSEKAKRLNDQIKDDVKDLADMQKFEERLIKEQKRYADQLEVEKQRQSDWNDDKKSKIKNLKKKKKELSNIDFDDEEDKINAFNEIDGKVDDVTSELSELKRNKSMLDDTIDNAKSWKSERKSKIKKCKNQIHDLEHIEYDVNRELFELLDVVNSKMNKLESSCDSIQSDIKSAKKSIDKMSSEKEHLKDSKCPYCLQTYSEAKVKLDELLIEFENTSNELSDSKKSLKKKNKSIDKLTDKIDQIKDELDFDSISDLEKTESKYINLKEKLSDLESETNPYTKSSSISDMENELDGLNKSISGLKKTKSDLVEELSMIKCEYSSLKDLYKDKSTLDLIDNEIETLKSTENPYDVVVNDISNMSLDDSKNDEINELADTIEHKKFLHKLLTNKNSFIRKALLDKNIPFLNTKLSYYLNRMGLPHKVEFTNEMTAKISQFDTEIEFENLSTGQKARINIALSFAFRDVLQKNHSKLNFCMLDECLDFGLSNVGVQLAAKMLKVIAEENNLSMYIISHRDEISSMFKQTLEIELRNGFSNIKKGE